MRTRGRLQRGMIVAGTAACLLGLSVFASDASAQRETVITTTTTTDTTYADTAPAENGYPDDKGSFSAYGPLTGMDEVPPERDAFGKNRPIAPEPWNRAVSLDLSLGSMLINTVFFPVKLAVGIVGAEIGGLAGALNGGDQEAARGVWNVTTDGSYFVTPAALDGRERFTLGSDAP